MPHNRIYREWARLGGGLSVAASPDPVDLEDLVVRTAAAAPGDARLFWVAAAWLGVHHALLNVRRLTGRLRDVTDPDSAVVGAMLSVARSVAGTATSLDSALKHCRPLHVPRPLFDVVAANPVLAVKAREGTLELFSAWGFWQDDSSPRTDAIRPVQWVLANCPEFQSRAVFGAGLEAEVIDVVIGAPATVRDLSTRLAVTYSAAHAAASRLIGRGWLRKTRDGRRQVLALREELRVWYASYPSASPRLRGATA